MSPTPINYLHVKYIDPLLMPASELLGGRVGNRRAIWCRAWVPHLDFMHWQEH